MVVNSVPRLMELGMTEYEARTYISLLQDNPVTAYEAAKRAGIPTAKIYGVMARLLEKEVVLELEEGGKKRYIPQDPDEYLNACSRRSTENISCLRKALEDVPSSSNVSYIWNLNTPEAVLERAGNLISKSDSTLLLSAWPRELSSLKKELEKAEARGVKIAVVHFGESDFSVGQMYSHPIADTLHEERGGRGLTLVSDSRSALMGTLSDDPDSSPRGEGAWSRGKGFIMTAEDYIKHDVYIMKIVQRFDRQLIDMFGENYTLLRNIFENTDCNRN